MRRMDASQESRERGERARAWTTHIGRPHDTADLLHGVEVRTQATVHGENLLVDDGGNWQAVEAVGKGLPQLDVVTTLALVVEAVDAVDAGAFVVASEDEEVLGVLDLVGKQEADSLQRLLSAIDVVAQEEVVGFGREASVLKEAQEIVVLAMDIAADLSSVASHAMSATVRRALRSIRRPKSLRRERTLMGASSSSRIG